MQLFGELRRRNIFKVGLAYAILSWLIVRIAGLILPAFNAPPWSMQALVLVLILLFPITALLSWAYELTPDGFKPTAEVDSARSITYQTGQRLNRIIMVLVAVAGGFWAIERFLLPEELPEIVPDVSYRSTLAVLPFADRSEQGNSDESFAYGIHAELARRLGRIAALNVRGRRSVYESWIAESGVEAIGDRLGVGSLVSGDVAVAGEGVTVRLELTDTRSGTIFWDDTFDTRTGSEDVFKLLGEAAESLTMALDADLTDEERAAIRRVDTTVDAAMGFWFTGQMLDARNGGRAVAAYRQAATFDPLFAGAWAAIAAAGIEARENPGASGFAAARREIGTAVLRAIRLDDNQADVLAALGWHQLVYNYDWSGAEESFRRALLLESNNRVALRGYARLLSWLGNGHDAVVAGRLALAADPLSGQATADLYEILINAEAWSDADMLADTVALESRNESLSRNIWIGHLRNRHAEAAAAALVLWAGRFGRDPEAAASVAELLIRSLALGEAVTIEPTLVELLDVGFDSAELHASIGDAEATIEALTQAEQSGSGPGALMSLRVNPALDFVRDDPRFQELARTVGLD